MRNEGSGTRNEGSAWIFPSSFEEGCRRRRRGGVAARRTVDHPVALRAPPLLFQGGEKDRRGAGGARALAEGLAMRAAGRAMRAAPGFSPPLSRRGAAEGGGVVSPREGRSTTPSRCARHPSFSKEGKKTAGARGARERWLKDSQ